MKHGRKAPPGVRIVRKPDGREYHYAGTHGGAPRIEAEPYSPEYYLELAEKMRPDAGVPQNQIRRLIVEFRGDVIPAKASSTQADYRRCCDRIETRWGTMPIAMAATKGFRRDVRAWRDEMKGTPRAADYVLGVFRHVLQRAVDAGDLTVNPLDNLPRLHRSNRADVIWTPDEFARLLSAAQPVFRPVLILAAHTGLRRGDLVQLTWTACEGDAIRLITSKRRRAVVVPILAPVRAALAALPRASTQVLLNTYNRPWTVDGVASAFDRARERTGIAKRFHDLRGTAATMFYGAGVAREDIAKIMGWSLAAVDAILDVYVGDAALVQRVTAAVRQAGGGFKSPVSP